MNEIRFNEHHCPEPAAPFNNRGLGMIRSCRQNANSGKHRCQPVWSIVKMHFETSLIGCKLRIRQHDPLPPFQTSYDLLSFRVANIKL